MCQSRKGMCCLCRTAFRWVARVDAIVEQTPFDSGFISRGCNKAWDMIRTLHGSRSGVSDSVRPWKRRAAWHVAWAPKWVIFHS